MGNSADSDNMMMMVVIIIILIIVGVGGYILTQEKTCPGSGNIISEECKCGEEMCSVGNICEINGSNTQCLRSDERDQYMFEQTQDHSSGLGQHIAMSETQEMCGNEDCGEHGECYQGNCLCSPGWTGPHCTVSSMDWTRISDEEGGNKVVEIEGEKYCANNYYSEINENGGDCILCPSSDLTDNSNMRSIAPNNSSINDCRCENINGYNLNYIDFESKTCNMCPQDEESTMENPSMVVKDSGLVGTVEDCVCNSDGGWYSDENASGCFKCPMNSEFNQIQKRCDCITGYTKNDEENRCVMNDDFKQYLNTCGIYRFDLDDNGEVLIRDNKPVINGTVSNINDVNVFDPNTDNHGRAATWFVNHESQFSFTESGTCQYKLPSGSKVNCGEPGTLASEFDDNCNKCKDGKTLVWNENDGFQCIDDVCSINESTTDNIEKCFQDTNVIPTQDEKFLRETTEPGNYICKKSDPNNALSPNMCDASILNIGGSDSNGDPNTLPNSDTIRIPDISSENFDEALKTQYSENRYTKDENTGKIICNINDEIRGRDSEDNNEKRCLEKNNICERFNVNERGEFEERVCKNTSKCVNIDVYPYYDCVDPIKEEPLTTTTVDPATQYFKDGQYNKCPNFVIRDGAKIPISDSEAENSSELIIKGYGKLCHLNSALLEGVGGDGVCGWGYMSEQGAIELKKHDDPIGGADITANGSLPKQTMQSYFNLPITASQNGTLQYNKYNCECAKDFKGDIKIPANSIGKKYRDYQMTLDSQTFCFAPTPTADTNTASEDSRSSALHLPWEYVYQPLFDRYGERVPEGNDPESLRKWKSAVIDGEKLSCFNDTCDETNYPNDGIPSFPNSINNLSAFLDCSKEDFDNTNTADDYMTGNFFYFDRFGTDVGTGHPPQCLQCSDKESGLEGYNQIHKKWLGWNPQNTGDNPTDFNTWKANWLNAGLNDNQSLIPKAKINVAEPSSSGYQQNICGKAYPGYAGTVYEGDTKQTSVGGEKINGGERRPVPKGDPDNPFVKRKQAVIDKAKTLNRITCPDNVSINWSPEKFWFSSDQNKSDRNLCNIWNSDGLLAANNTQGSENMEGAATNRNEPWLHARSDGYDDLGTFFKDTDPPGWDSEQQGCTQLDAYSGCNNYNYFNSDDVAPATFVRGPEHKWNCGDMFGEHYIQRAYCKMPPNTWGI